MYQIVWSQGLEVELEDPDQGPEKLSKLPRALSALLWTLGEDAGPGRTGNQPQVLPFHVGGFPSLLLWNDPHYLSTTKELWKARDT